MSIVDEYFDDFEKLRQYESLGTVGELSERIKEEDVLKFYYCESLDKYLVGQRLDTMYYAEITNTCDMSYIMSRYLPWGEHVVAPDTVWKEHTYPSEPKEIHFTDWLKGFAKQRGWE